MNIDSFQIQIGRVVDRATEISESFVASAPDNAIASAASGLRKVVADARGLVEDMGGLDATGSFTAPKDILALALWERQTRWGLHQLIATSAAASDAMVAQVNISAVQQRSYVVVQGDSFLTIASQQLGGWEQWINIAKINGLDPGAPILPGQQLILPEVARVREPT